MFQIGQRVRCINPARAGAFKMGGVYEIVGMLGDSFLVLIDDKGLRVKKSADKFEKLRANLPPPKNDYEWLDRVQQNFKD